MRVLIIILFNFRLSSVVFLSGSPAVYSIVACGLSAFSIPIAGVPVPTFTLQPASTLFALTNATYTTQIGMPDYVWTSATAYIAMQFGNRTILNVNESSIVIVNPFPVITGTLSASAGSTTTLLDENLQITKIN